MKSTANERQREQGSDVREIPKWARRYAQNRTLPVVVFQVIFALGCVVFGGLSYLTAWAYLHGERLLAGAAMLALCGCLVGTGWFAFVGGDKVIRRVSAWLYRGEGMASTELTAEDAMARPPVLALSLFMFCVFASVGLGLLGFFPRRYLQPISATYAVPFMVYLGIRFRSAGSPFMFLWPALYGIHAILLMAGVPIYFTSERRPLDILVPLVGYSLVAALAAHLYSRVALRRLRKAAAVGEMAEEDPSPVRWPPRGGGAEVGDSREVRERRDQGAGDAK